jgi:hypothetical protein
MENSPEKAKVWILLTTGNPRYLIAFTNTATSKDSYVVQAIAGGVGDGFPSGYTALSSQSQTVFISLAHYSSSTDITALQATTPAFADSTSNVGDWIHTKYGFGLMGMRPYTNGDTSTSTMSRPFM